MSFVEPIIFLEHDFILSRYFPFSFSKRMEKIEESITQQMMTLKT